MGACFWRAKESSHCLASSVSGAIRRITTTPLLTAAEGIEAMKKAEMSGYKGTLTRGMSLRRHLAFDHKITKTPGGGIRLVLLDRTTPARC